MFATTGASGDREGVARSQGRASWKPLVGGRLKCNVDFSWFEQEGATGVALSWLKSLVDNVIESDCLLIISALSHSLSDISKL
ncbi:hypothetical protein Goklo_006759, partial [Gossypium klotzschianum]|nr:hypothetical protein [Gossypium klotzschianum]